MTVETTHQPPPAALWERLRAFDRTCDISMHRAEQVRSAPRPPPVKEWVVTIWPRTIPDVRIWENAKGGHPTLAEAIRLAVEDGEKRGWNRTPQGPAKAE